MLVTPSNQSQDFTETTGKNRVYFGMANDLSMNWGGLVWILRIITINYFLANVTYNFGLKYLNDLQQIRGISHSEMSYIPAKCIHMSEKPRTEIYCTSSWCRENCYLRLSDLKVLDWSKKTHQSLWEHSIQVHVYSAWAELSFA